MGDSILNIGEAIIFTVLGEKLKIHQYRGLANTLNGHPEHVQVQDYTFQSIWGTRSGCRIGRIFSETPDRNAVFKEGLQDKLYKEKENIERWNRLFPGITAKIFGYEEKNRNATLLLEHLPGHTLKEIALNDNPDRLSGALRVLASTVAKVWRETKQPQIQEITFADQIGQRLDDVYKVHPELKTVSKTIGSLKAPSFRELLERMKGFCRAYPAPFSVRIHGDFNIDNILYNEDEDRIHFVDLHRSGQADYVQDVSVFLVSNFRIPIEHGPIRKRLNQISLAFMEFARSFARDQEDATFEVRLALGLIRSFTTSTRFVLDKGFAKDLFLRAIYLLDSLEAFQDRGEDYALAEEILVD